MMAITRSLSTTRHTITIDGQDQDFYMVPQFSSCLRDDLILYDSVDPPVKAGYFNYTTYQTKVIEINLRYM